MRSLGRSIKEFSADDMLVYAAALSYQLWRCWTPKPWRETCKSS